MKIRRLPELHIKGYKAMSISSGPIEYLSPRSVYIPTSIPNTIEILKKEGDKVLLGEVIMEAKGRFPYPILSPISGVVKGIVKKWHPSNKMVPMLEIENDFNEELVDTFKHLKPKEMTREELIEVMRKSGLVGMGGAGFPAYAKYNTDKKVDMVIMNLAECEPFITCDYTCVLYNAQDLMYGFKYLLKAADCHKGIIAIKDKPMNKILIDIITPLLTDEMEIRYLNDVYPAGWERYTVETIAKRTYKFLPIEAGVLVSNATTCFSFARTLKYGIPPSMKYVTITGDRITNPGNVLCKFGTNVSELLPLFGGMKEGAKESDTICISGGPMTGNAMFFSDFIVTPTLGSVILREDKLKNRKTPECLGCGRCVRYCPTFLAPFDIKRELKVGNIEELKKLGVTKCIQCGLCSYICPSRIDLTSEVAKAKEIVLKLGR